jgi:preprotein translocase subunit YajC
MWNWISDGLILAQNAPAAAPASDGGPGPVPGPSGSLVTLFGPILVAFAVMMWLNTRTQRKDQTKRQDMLRSLKKNDPVVTIGGIIGTIVSVSEDASEVTLKMVDDSRIKFRADAIRDVLTKPETPPATSA